MDNKFCRAIDTRPKENRRWARRKAEKRHRLEQERQEASDSTVESIGPLGAFLRQSQRRGK